MQAIRLLFLIFCLSLLNTANAKYFPGALTNADWLAEHIDDVTILDVRKDLKSFDEEGHIENAILVDVDKIRIDREIDGKKLTRMRPDAKSFEQFMQQHGINKKSRIVITHRGKSAGQVAGAARLYWQMKFYSVKNVALLDGGNAAWVAALEDLSKEKTDIPPGDYSVGKQNPEILATMHQVQQAMKNNSATLLDTRDLRQHIGIDKKDYVFAYGHIPGAKILPYKLLNPAKGIAVYYPPDKLKNIIKNMGIDISKPLILFCNSAYECSSDWFVLHELLGNKDVRIYDGSLHQWTQYKANPMATQLGK